MRTASLVAIAMISLGGCHEAAQQQLKIEAAKDRQLQDGEAFASCIDEIIGTFSSASIEVVRIAEWRPRSESRQTCRSNPVRRLPARSRDNEMARSSDQSGIHQTLTDRGRNYDDFAERCRVEQSIKRAFADSPQRATIPDDCRSALEMIVTKVSQITAGKNLEHHDSWHRIAGYAILVVDRLEPGP